MRLGIDFGTTRVVVSAADRGNYPVVQFEAPDGGVRDWFPPLVAARGEDRRYGWDAWLLQAEPGWTIVRSLKRILSEAGPQTEIELGDAVLPLSTLLGEMTAALRTTLLEGSNLPPGDREKLEVQLGVPANANTNQRFLTAEAFRRGGFEVLGLLNEPSAACIEFSNRNPVDDADLERFVLVYDLGGGTFDASLVRIRGLAHSVVSTEGISTLGGDDFDDILAEMALDVVGAGPEARDEMSQAEWFRLREECRQKKESIRPNSRKIALDLEWVCDGWSAAVVPVADYYSRCAPAAEETFHAIEDLLGRNGFPADGNGEDRKIEAVYVAGGGSELPMIPRGLRESFGRRVKRSAHGRSSTAIGLAIQADAVKGYVLRDRFTRYFGVYREEDHGRRISFDPLFSKETQLPSTGEEPLRIARSYSPTHNVGHFRYLECSQLTMEGQPAGDITLWDDILFPFDPGLKDASDLAHVDVGYSPAASAQVVEEAYSCDAGGSLAVTIRNISGRYGSDFRLGRWATSSKRVKPGRAAQPRKARAKTRRARSS